MPQTLLTKPSTGLSDIARVLVRPAGITSTAWPSVRDTCARLGLGFDPWQADAGKLILAKDSTGLFATDTVVISIPRQVGKTYLIGAIVFALCLIHPGITVLWTAHRFKTARETFASMKGMARLPKLQAHVLNVVNGAGSEAIEFRNGSRVLFGARERGFGRGFAGVAVIVFDEAQILGQNAVDDMIPAANVVDAPFPLVIYTGTPPKPTDPSEVFTTLRREAKEEGDGKAEVLYVELGADPDGDPMDRAQWRLANPSYPHRTSERAILRMRKNLGLESFRREGLGIWDGDGPGVMPSWHDRRTTGALPTTAGMVLGIATALDGSRSSIAAAYRHDGVVVMGVVDRRPGKGWIVDEVKRLVDTYGCPVIVRAKGALADLADDFYDANLVLEEVDESAYMDACATVRRMVEEGGIAHPNHPPLNRAAAAAVWRKVGQRGMFADGGKGDISMLEAATLAAANVDSDYNVLDSAY